MAVLKLRIYWVEDESVYRDIAIRHTQTFRDLHEAILKCWEFDNKHQATFYRSNDSWQRGREITLEKYEKNYKAEPLLMQDVVISSEIKAPDQKFIYIYDFIKNWEFNVELIKVEKGANQNGSLPACVRKEGLGPTQYGAQAMVNKRLTEIEDKFGLNLDELKEGYGDEGEETDSDDDNESADESYGDDEI